MLRITQNSGPEGAKSYYTSSDYYTEGQELVGRWGGKGAAQLGLAGEVEKDAWEALCDNREPSTGKPLTPRQKSDRRVGYDFNFHCPKSVSLLYGITRDERIVEAFRESVDATMEDIEADMQTRVRARGRNSDRVTANMVWGEFVHLTARPVDGVPDPHLHAHCFVFNTTWDDVESRWKAGQFAGIKRDGEYFESLFHSRLARKLEELGLPVERTKRGWELSGVPQSAVRQFSRRTALIEGKAREKGITDPEVKGQLGARTRERKAKDLSMDELCQQWSARLSAEEVRAMSSVRGRIGEEGIPEDETRTAESVSRAISHCFERSAVIPERKLVAAAMRQSIGTAGPDKVREALAGHDLVVGERSGRRMATTRAVLSEESRMVDFARSGRGTCSRLGGDGEHVFRNTMLARGQVGAVLHVLNSRDRVMLIRGAAGTGKTTMMKEAVSAIEAAGTTVHTFAPSADASRGVLRQEGFDDAETVARLLADPNLQQELTGGVLWIDEAGLLGTRTMADVFALAGRLDCRVVLSGDRRQHGSVERGAALRLLEEEAGLKAADIREIQRQKGQYMAAVQALSEGRVGDGFRELDRLGWVKELDGPNRYAALADDYVASLAEGKTVLAVSPTHVEGDRITEQIRLRMRQSGRLKGGERRLLQLVNTNLTHGERADPLNYAPGDVLVFHQNGKGYRKGDRLIVGEAPLPLDQAERFQVYRQSVLPLAAGDAVRITRNGTTTDGLHRVNNGTCYTVKGFSKAGDVVLANGWTLSKEYGHLAFGYVLTSHASQGKTVDRVLIGESSESLPASSREQFYVSVSRGRERATVYTDDRKALLEAVSRSDDRITATELAQDRLFRARTAAVARAATHDLDSPDTPLNVEREELVYDR